MSPIATICSADTELELDLPVVDPVLLLLIFADAWTIDWTFDPPRQIEPLTVATIQTRMNLLGYTDSDAVEDFRTLGPGWLRYLQHLAESSDSSGSEKRAYRLLDHLLNSGIIDVEFAKWKEESFDLANALTSYWFDRADPDEYPRESTVIRTALSAFQKHEHIYVNMPFEYYFGAMPNEIAWNDNETPSTASLAGYRSSLAWRNTKPILLLEGSFDAQVVQSIFELRFPAFADCISIADFTQGAEGGASGLARTLRTLAQLEVPNTIIGLFDNDAAGNEAVNLLERYNLPSNIGYSTYPDLEFARHYPTVGPTGTAAIDINGKALSVEHFLGADCLTENGEYVPVEWTGLNHKLQVYQGSIMHKRDIQKRFQRKIVSARQGKASSSQDWSGLDILGNFVIDAVLGVSSRRTSHRHS